MAREAEFILDASALLAVMRSEPGSEKVLEIIDNARIHSVQIAEVVRKLREVGIGVDELREAIQEMCIPLIEEFSLLQAYETERYCIAGLSLGDRICLAAANRHNATAVTADRRWKEVADANRDLNLKVMLIR
jgi:ribonuclease VapC